MKRRAARWPKEAMVVEVNDCDHSCGVAEIVEAEKRTVLLRCIEDGWMGCTYMGGGLEDLRPLTPAARELLKLVKR